MHITAFNNLKHFYAEYMEGEKYRRENCLGFTPASDAGKLLNQKVLDVGSMVVKDQDRSVGSVRGLFKEHTYTGIDITEGKNVDVVYDGKHFPYGDEAFDIIISTSCFEHDKQFWMTFKAMARILKTGGYIYLNAPSAGHVHRYPIDCWRFYPDAWAALAEWGDVTLVEQFIDTGCYWRNNVGIFVK